MRINVRETGMIEQSCSCGIGHPTKEGIEYCYNRFGGEGNTRRTWEVHGCCGLPGHCWLADREHDKRQKRTKEMQNVQPEKGSSLQSHLPKLQRAKSKSRRDKKTI